MAIFYSYSAEINFSRQNLTSQILTTRVDPYAVRLNLFYQLFKTQLLGNEMSI